jgi:hypothetical protein
MTQNIPFPVYAEPIHYCADGAVSATIREAHCPVMTVPSNFSG